MLLNTIVSESLRRTRKRPEQEDILEEYDLIKIILRQPQLENRDLHRRLTEVLGTRTAIHVGDTLHYWAIPWPDVRMDWSLRLGALFTDVTALLTATEPPTAGRMETLWRNLDSRSQWPFPTYKAFLHLLAEDSRLDEELRTALKAWLPSTTLREAKNFVRNMFEYGGFPRERQDDGLRGLEAEIKDLRTALEYANRRLEERTQELEAETNEAAQSALATLFRKMAHRSSDHLLDRIAEAEQQLVRLKKSKFAFPPEVDPLRVMPRIFFKFLKKMDVQPMAEVGQTLDLSLDDSVGYDYHGSDFEGPGDRKRVRVETPGWTHEGRVIALPRVRQIQDSEVHHD